MVLRKTWVSGNFGSDLGSVFDGFRSLVFFEIFNCRSLVIFIFPFGLQESIFQGSWVQLMELSL